MSTLKAQQDAPGTASGIEAVPRDWCLVPLGDILLSLETGKRPKGGAVNDTSGVLSISAEHMDQLGRIDTSIPRFVPKDFYEKMKVGHLKAGDVLVVKDGATTGKTAYVDSALSKETLVVNEHVFVCRTSISSIEPRWVFYCLWSEAGQSQIRDCLRGSAQGGIIRSFVDDVSIPLPPLPEQRRIVAAIETHFTRLDAAVAALERAQANLRRYRASVLKAACEGQLVPTEAELARDEGREYETADALLERILAERRARWEAQAKRRGKYKDPVAPDTSELPELPEGWAWSTFDQLAWRLEGGTAETATDTRSNRSVLRSSAVRQGFIDYDDCRYLPDDASGGCDRPIATRDLLFTRLSGTLEYVGNCAVVGQLNGLTIEFPDRIFRGRCVSCIAPDFVQHAFGERTLRTALEKKAKSTAGHQRISLSDLREYWIPLPPLTEQRRIVAELERRLSVVSQAEAAVEANLARAERLRQSILKRAFAGELVPQDPDDEPASVLLARINAEREAAQAAAKAARKPRRRRSGKARAGKAGAR